MSKNPLQNFVVRYGSGDLIFNEGDLGATMYIVQAGRVRLFRQNEGQQRDLGELEKGDFFGEMSILEGLPRTNSAEAIEPAELIEINSTTFDKMIKGNIEIAIRMLRKLSIRLREAERKMDEIQAVGVHAAAAARPSTQPSRKTSSQTDSGLRLEFEGGAYQLNEVETLIGRYDPVTEQSPDIDLTDLDLKRSVSRRHARILQTEAGYVIVEEVGALNGTFVNGTQVEAGDPTPLRDGDEVGLGMVKTTFRC